MAERHGGGRLHGEMRRNLIPPEAVLESMNIAAGDIVLDIGAGTGYFAIPAARFVGENGRVIASDISVASLAELKMQLPPSNSVVQVLECDIGGVDLPDASVDKILMAFVLHEIADKPSYLREVKRLLKPGGELTIVEWDAVDSPMGPPLSDRIDHPSVLSLAERAGLRQVRYSKPNDYHYLCALKAE